MQQKSFDSDETLILQIKSGDLQALPKLVERWHKEFCNKAYWLTKNKELSKDIAQDSWKIIIEKIQDLKEPKSFKYWAMRIVFTKSLDALRLDQRKRSELHMYAYNHSEIEEDIIDHSDLKKKLLKAIYALPDQQQAVIKLFYVEDYSLKKISEILKISVGTAKSRLFNAREKLKQTLKQ